ncbi:hypothetical protein [Pedobacter panaciterrae]
MKRILLLGTIVLLGFTSCKKENQQPEKNTVTYKVEGTNLNVTVAPKMPRYYTLVNDKWEYSVDIYSGTTAYLEVKLSDLSGPQTVKASISINGKVVEEINEHIDFNESKSITYKMP